MIDMKNKKWLMVSCILLAVVIAGVALWTKERNTHSCADIIPNDSKAVAVLRPGLALKQLDLEDAADDILAGSGLAESGLDFASDILGFVSADNTIGFVAHMKDADALERTFVNKGFSVSSARGLRWAVCDGWLCCFDSGRMLLAGPADKTDDSRLRNMMYRLMTKETHPSVLLALLRKDTPFALVASGDVMQNLIKQTVGDFSSYINLSKTLLSTALEIHEKSIALDTDVTTEDNETKERMKELHTYLVTIDEVNGIFLPPFPMFWMAANVNAERLATAIEKNPHLSLCVKMLQGVVDTREMTESLDGKISLALDNISSQSVDFLLSAKVKDDGFARKGGIASALASLALPARQKSPTEYTVELNNTPLSFGVEDKLLYATNSDSLAASIGSRTLHKTLLDREKEIGQCRLYASMDMKRMMRIVALPLLPRDAGLGVCSALGKMGRLDIMTDLDKKIRLELSFDVPVKDVVKELATE